MIYVTRLLDFLLRKVLAFTVIALLLVFGFYFGMNAANLYILAKEGLQMRAQVVMTGEGREELSKYYTLAFLDRDERLRDRTYDDYTVRTFNHRMGLNWIQFWPWRDEAGLMITERITYIDGELPEEKKTEEQLAEKRRIYPPAWDSSAMTLRFVKQDGLWKIAGIEVTEVIPATASPIPSAPTPTSTPTAPRNTQSALPTASAVPTSR